MADTIKTSIKIKKFWYSEIASDGGAGVLWKEVQISQREGSVKFNGSTADTTNYKNILGSNLESDSKKGDKTVVFQLADLTPAVVADFTGGTVSSDSDSDTYEAPENENASIELSVMFLTAKNVLYVIPRVSFDSYPMMDDDDLHYYNIEGVVLQPEKSGVTTYKYHVLKDAAIVKNDITSFVLAAQTGAATISTVNHTVAITVANGTVVTALEPTIGVSLGAGVSPNSGVATDFTNPVTYTVMAADGTLQDWVVTVTVAP